MVFVDKNDVIKALSFGSISFPEYPEETYAEISWINSFFEADFRFNNENNSSTPEEISLKPTPPNAFETSSVWKKFYKFIDIFYFNCCS